MQFSFSSSTVCCATALYALLWMTLQLPFAQGFAPSFVRAPAIVQRSKSMVATTPTTAMTTVATAKATTMTMAATAKSPILVAQPSEVIVSRLVAPARVSSRLFAVNKKLPLRDLEDEVVPEYEGPPTKKHRDLRHHDQFQRMLDPNEVTDYSDEDDDDYLEDGDEYDDSVSLDSMVNSTRPGGRSAIRVHNAAILKEQFYKKCDSSKKLTYAAFIKLPDITASLYNKYLTIEEINDAWLNELGSLDKALDYYHYVFLNLRINAVIQKREELRTKRLVERLNDRIGKEQQSYDPLVGQMRLGYLNNDESETPEDTSYAFDRNFTHNEMYDTEGLNNLLTFFNSRKNPQHLLSFKDFVEWDEIQSLMQENELGQEFLLELWKEGVNYYYGREVIPKYEYSFEEDEEDSLEPYEEDEEVGDYGNDYDDAASDSGAKSQTKSGGGSKSAKSKKGGRKGSSFDQAMENELNALGPKKQGEITDRDSGKAKGDSQRKDKGKDKSQDKGPDNDQAAVRSEEDEQEQSEMRQVMHHINSMILANDPQFFLDLDSFIRVNYHLDEQIQEMNEMFDDTPDEDLETYYVDEFERLTDHKRQLTFQRFMKWEYVEDCLSANLMTRAELKGFFDQFRGGDDHLSLEQFLKMCAYLDEIFDQRFSDIEAAHDARDAEMEEQSRHIIADPGDFELDVDSDKDEGDGDGEP